METASPNLWTWVILVVAVIDIMIFACGYYLGRLHGQKPRTVVAPPPQPTEGSLAAALDQGLGPVHERLRAIEGRLSKVSSGAPRQQAKNAEGDRLQYAARMAEHGNSVEELMAICNLGRGEAELIKLLNDTRGGEGHPTPLTASGADRP